MNVQSDLPSGAKPNLAASALVAAFPAFARYWNVKGLRAEEVVGILIGSRETKWRFRLT
jgi:hypothetical protein